MKITETQKEYFLNKNSKITSRDFKLQGTNYQKT